MNGFLETFQESLLAGRPLFLLQHKVAGHAFCYVFDCGFPMVKESLRYMPKLYKLSTKGGAKMPSPNQCLLDTIEAAGCGGGGAGGGAGGRDGVGEGKRDGVGERGGGGGPSGCAANAIKGGQRRLAGRSEDDKRALGLCWQIKVKSYRSYLW